MTDATTDVMTDATPPPAGAAQRAGDLLWSSAMVERRHNVVLVVDDNAANRALAQATLEDEGYRVVLAASGEDGLAAFQREPPDCVLLDIQMPGMDGVTLCQRIREAPGGPDVSIVFLTAQRDVDFMWRYRDDVCGGGLWWTVDRDYKHAITNELFVQAAAQLAQRLGDRGSIYFERAVSVWNWFEASGMINNELLVNDGLHTATCRNNGDTAWTYNQGVLLVVCRVIDCQSLGRLGYASCFPGSGDFRRSAGDADSVVPVAVGAGAGGAAGEGIAVGGGRSGQLSDRRRGGGQPGDGGGLAGQVRRGGVGQVRAGTEGSWPKADDPAIQDRRDR